MGDFERLRQQTALFREWAELQWHRKETLRMHRENILRRARKDADFQRFVERVLKPIPEATPDFVGYIERFPK